ncbi:hypothetical protein [Sphingobium ummariense]|uniref:Uncharacterized protein n=1 Tax=Sphingobium ummariense RL-3 TaxID=1346791 RepID=T0J3T0_9SPHN|nr:hypothetical protein [Sphingobium ummariense]EQB31517.1 hypothetical protein M529_14460 [Sphingobium ummariense RL-3]
MSASDNDPAPSLRDQAYADIAGMKLSLALQEIAAMNITVARSIADLLNDALDLAVGDAHPLGARVIAGMLDDDIEHRIAFYEVLFGDDDQRAAVYGPNGAN